MAEDLPATGICGGNWWSLPKNDHVGNYGCWLVNDIADLKSKSCKLQQDSININSSFVFQDLQKPHRSISDSDHSGGLMDSSTLQMMAFGISSSSNSSSSPPPDWAQTLLGGNSVMEEDHMNSQIRKDWSPKSFVSTQEDSSLDQQQRLNPSTNSGNPYVYQSTPLIQSLFEPSDHGQQQSFYNDQTATNYSNSSPQSYGTILSEVSPSWPKVSSYMKPSMPSQQSQHTGGLHFTNNTPFWNTSPDFPTSSPQPEFALPTFEGKPNCPNFAPKLSNEVQVRDSGSMVKNGSEPTLKRARIETPSPLPTFKVRKEKLGDRITALQQLVSPFGKTDTASVLHEAIEYIKFLHDQVNVLSTPYMKNGNPIQQQQVGERVKETEDLKSRGLCLVPISSTFPVAHETTADFWTPTFGGTFSVAYQSSQVAIDDNFNTKRR